MFEVVCISFAFFFGLAVRQVGLPPLVGFLAAGFAINLAGPPLGLPDQAGAILHYVAHLGVLLLLFAVGLKLRLAQMVQPHVLGAGLGHFAVSVAILAPGLRVLAVETWPDAVLLAIVLSFSSTVLTAKILEGKRDLGAFYGRTAIGILILQDVVALLVLALWQGATPSVWALGLLALPFARPALYWLLDFTGHDELLVLMGMMLALVVGGMGFAALGLSSEIGALAMGLMLSTHRRAKELSDALWSLREIFLVGFFLQIGMSGLPDLGAAVFAVAVVVVLPLKGALFFALLVAFGLRARTAFLTALSLTAYSEFALIVSALVLPDWVVPLALALALSYLVAAPLTHAAQRLFEAWEPQLTRWETTRLHPDEVPANLGPAQVMILGMGRTGTAAYDRLAGQCPNIVALDSDTYKVASHRAAGRNVFFADVDDLGFWRVLDIGRLRGVILAIDNVEAKVLAAKALRRRGFAGPIVSHVLYEDHLARLTDAGATHTYLTMTQAGVGLADQAGRALGLGDTT